VTSRRMLRRNCVGYQLDSSAKLVLQVTDHARQLLEKHFRQPFLNLDYGAGVQRMDMETVQEGLVW